MNRILIVHLKRFGDLISAGQTITAIKAKHPHAEVSLLCFEEFSSVARLIPGLKKTYTISRNTLLTLKNGKLYNTGFALEELRLRLMPLIESPWDKIVNLTNDLASAHLCSWIACHDLNVSLEGISIDQHGLAVSSNNWASVFNDVLPQAGLNSPFNFRDVWAKMMNVSDQGVAPLLTNPRNEETVSRNFQTLRRGNIKVIGIQATCSVEGKGLGAELVARLAEEISTDGHRPVLLIAPNELEREFASQILEQIEYQPIVVESDFTALSSVIRNLDLLITPDTVTKHFADAHGTACIEVSLGSSPVFKQATMNPKSVLLSSKDRSLNQVSADDILSATTFSLSNGKTKLELGQHTTAYRPVKIADTTAYQVIGGSYNQDDEFNRHATSALILKMDQSEDSFVDDYALLAIKAATSAKSFTNWIEQTKEQSAMTMKDVLHAIRALLQMSENPRKSAEFIESLDRLFANTEYLLPANVAVHFFKSKVESLPPSSFQQNTKSIEEFLFKLKGDLQHTMNLLSQWHALWTESKFESRKQRQAELTQESL
tara:strand:- start:9818 stop:11452 length:1635 start_codon:yes stop_codon:yes gene_type:complete